MDNKQRRQFIRAMSLLSQLGVTMATCVIIGVLLGKFLDGLFGTSPWLLLVMSLLGAAASIKACFDLIMKK